MATLPLELEELIIKNHFAYLCTIDKGNQPHVTPIFYVFTPSPISLYFLSSSKSRKVINLMDHPKVALTIDTRDPVDPHNNLGVMIKGIAEIVGRITLERPMTDWEERLLIIFKGKYLEFETWKDEYMSRTEPESIVWMKIEPLSMTWWKNWNFKTLRFRTRKKIPLT